LKVLPNFNKEKYSRYVEDKNKGVFAEESKKKWFNDFNLVGAIGELWTSYKKFFEYNGYKVSALGQLLNYPHSVSRQATRFMSSLFKKSLIQMFLQLPLLTYMFMERGRMDLR
jgi:hypothetical protein